MFSLLRRRPLVSVCIPAWKSERFITATVQSALSQTVTDIEVIISNDGGHPTPALHALSRLPRLRIITPRRRLGWVENTNHVLSRARGRYFMVLPHDDRLEPEYLEACLSLLESNPETFASYSNIATARGIMPAHEVTGDLETRAATVMRARFNGFSFRAVMPRRRADWPALRLRANPPSDLCVDTAWILQQSMLGELRRVPRPLYFKHVAPDTTHAAWASLPAATKRAGWAQHVAHCGEILKAAGLAPALVAELVAYRSDPRNVREAPPHLRQAMTCQ